MYAYWEYSRKSYLTLNSSQPSRKRHLKIILTRWVMTAGESKAELSTGYSTISENLGYCYPKQGQITDLLIGLDWAAVAVPDPAVWAQCGDTIAGHSRECPVTLTLQDQSLSLTSPPGRYSNLSLSGRLMIFTNGLSPNLLNIMVNVLEINQLNTSEGEAAVV